MSLESSTVISENYLLPPKGHIFWDIATGDLTWLGSYKPHPKVCEGCHREAEFFVAQNLWVNHGGEMGSQYFDLFPFWNGLIS